ncbi:MAG: NAD(P)/FAD-dependent oxidoreductase [Actinomycetota bacterium]|nr:NAD(P)/FAD-dependent oxidoreductase [Actinomycetota bacterium]MDQ3648403.1 NAD(P)/FAD-dependent oxidoreductase [Actinomycetota bacterium]
MSERFDVVVLGAGPGGRGAAGKLVGEGLRVAMLEGELVGGECPFWACIPTKALLRPVEARNETRRVAGMDAPDPRWGEVRGYRDYMNSGLEDGAKVKAYSDMGVEVIKEPGEITGPGRVRAGDRELEAENIVIATGTLPAIPPIEGLDQVDYWTNREASAMKQIPSSAVVLGGGPVGIEFAQMLSRYGSEVTLVEGADRLLSREDPEVSRLMAELLREEGIDVRLHTQADAVASEGNGGVRVTAGRDQISAERLLVAVGRSPRVEGIGLDTVGIEPGERGIEVDQHCEAAEGVYAVGDVTGISPFTHVASYQGWVASECIVGRGHAADYKAVPRVVFSDPEIAAVGLSAEQAREQGLDMATAEVDISRADRAETFGKDLKGRAGVVADRERGVLVGAWAVCPLASEWIHAAVVAVKADVPLETLRDSMMQFPTFSELLLAAVRQVDA